MMPTVNANSAVLYAASCSLALWVGSKVLFPQPKRAGRHREFLPLLGETWAAIKYADHYYDWEAEWTEKMEGGAWVFDVVGRPTEFVVGRPELIEDILLTQFEKFGKGAYVHEVLSDLLGDGIFTVDGHKWMKQRKTASNLFSMRELRESMATVVHGNLLTLDEIFQRAVDKRESVDLFQLFNRLTFEVITEIAFGVNFGAWPRNRSTRSRRRSITLSKGCLSGSWNRHGGGSSSDGLTSETSGNSRNTDDDAKAGEDLDPKYLRDIVVAFMTAGRDSTTAALSWFFYSLTQHPEVEAKIRHEILSKIPELVSGAIASPSMDQVNELVYLEAAVKEVLRLNPAVPSNIREALEDVVLCDGTVVKAGEAVSWSSYSLGRMPHIWGPDAKEFKPERWIDADTGKLLSVSPFKFTLFNGGPRICLGIKLSMMEIKITAASVLSKYHLRVVPGQDICYRLGLTLAMKNGLKVEIAKATSASCQ